MKYRDRATLKDNFLLKISLTYFFVHGALLISLSGLTAFAPDEGGYVAIFHNLYRSDFSLEGYVGWNGSGSINFLRLLYAPAKLLNLVGINEFLSVRLLAISTTYVALLMLLQTNQFRSQSQKRTVRWVSLAFFIPSVLLWTTLGLRESFIFLFLVSIFYLINSVFNSPKIAHSLLLVFVSAGLLVTKTYLYAIVVIATFLALFLLSLLQKRVDWRSLSSLALLLIPLILFPSITATVVSSAKSTIEVKVSAQKPAAVGSQITTDSSPILVSSRGQTLHDLNAQIEQNSFLLGVAKKTGLREIISSKANAAQLPGNSTESLENISQLQAKPASLRDPLSIVKATFNFLFIPAPFIDNGSFFLNMQSYESFAWYLYYGLFLFLLIGLLRGRYILSLSSIASTLFCLGFILESALVEINDGTAVRHRSVLLFGILIMIASFSKKDASLNAGKVRFQVKNP